LPHILCETEKIKQECPSLCNSCPTAPDVDCYPLSQTLGRCGPEWDGRCNKDLVDYAVYCNTENGWCGNGEDHKNAQDGDEYDWEPQSCKATTESPQTQTTLSDNNEGYEYDYDEMTPDEEEEEKPRPRFTSAAQKFEVSPQDNITLTCTVKNLGTSVIMWKKIDREGDEFVIAIDNVVVNGDSRIKLVSYDKVSISSIKQEDSGFYICSINDNGVDGDTLRHEVSIIVEETTEVQDPCNKCISDFDDAGGCECLKKDGCNPASLIPSGCYSCGEKAIKFCNA